MTAPVHLGENLRAARESRGLSIQQLSDDTTIPVRDLEALERGEVDALPRAMYRRAEVRAYAEAVGLDPDAMLVQLRAVAAPAPPVMLSSSTAVPPAVGLVAGPGPMVAAAITQRAAAPTMPRGLAPPLVGQRQAASSSVGARAGRALVVLTIGCAALLWGQAPDSSRAEKESALPALPLVEPAALMEDAVRLADPPPPPPAPTLRRVLYDPRLAVNGKRWPRDGRLDEGVLVVHSTPRGARVTVNGVGWGVTPVAIRYLPFGTLRVRVGKTDHAVQERVVQLSPAEPSRTLRLSLPQLSRRTRPKATTQGRDMLVITTVPDGARVTVNGIGWGTTPVSIAHLPAGTQRVRVVKDQFRSEERVVRVDPEQPGRVAITLKPAS